MHLQTPRLLLRAMRPSDDKDLFRIYGDPATNTFNPAGPYPDLAHAQKVLADRLRSCQRYGYDSWAIATQGAPDTLIGFGGLSVRLYGDETINNLGYRFATSAWGKGYATELSRFALEYGFRELGLDTISARVRRHHQASIHVLEKPGCDLLMRFMMWIMRRPAWFMRSHNKNGRLTEAESAADILARCLCNDLQHLP
ncbi:hypothetical protein NB701_000708 [Pantoea ananatis]|nr:hypothetical protein [Pantoea ananatis]